MQYKRSVVCSTTGDASGARNLLHLFEEVGMRVEVRGAMKAVVLEQPGGAEQLVYRDWPDPRVSAGEVLVQLRAAGLNHRDIWMRNRPAAGVPVILGSDGAGVVTQVGEGVSGLKVGDEVIINPSLGWSNEPAQPRGWSILGSPVDGTYAQMIKLPAAALYPKPTYMTWPEAAALGLSGLTAWRALTTRGKLQAGETVLVLGVGGGSATIVLQLAQAMGATVWVTSGHDDKLARARELGAEWGTNYRSGDWAAAVLEQSGGRGVSLVIDSVGEQTWPSSIKVLAPAGRLVSFGATSGNTGTVDIRSVFSRQISIHGTMMGNNAEFAAMLAFYTAHQLRPIVHTTMPLAQAAEVHRLLEAEGQFGKIVLTMDNA